MKVRIQLQKIVLACKERGSPDSDMEICLFMIGFRCAILIPCSGRSYTSTV